MGSQRKSQPQVAAVGEGAPAAPKAVEQSRSVWHSTLQALPPQYGS